MNPNDPNFIPSAPTPLPTSQPAAPPATPTVTPDNPEAYLNAISTQVEKTRFLSGKVLIAIGGALVALIIVIIIGVISNNIRQTAQSEITTLNTRLGDLRTILMYGQSNPPRSSTAIKVVAETNLITATHQNDLSEVYSTVGDANSSVSFESSATAELDDAKARGNLETAYITALRDQLLLVCSQLNVLHNSAKNDTQREALSAAYADFDELANRLPTSNN
ncbi:MAG: hypothetical protein LBQ11_00650 [Candidatus Nomurabacteria bacterium]|jgi:hypothetical protein|nr:hypothetical protein [Candidatus Nomurabacteria bacterium]